MRRLNLATVCEEAACPNIGECWTKKHATVMILGDTCTRACAFCNVKTGMPRAVDPLEPEHVADAAAELGLDAYRRHLGRPRRSARRRRQPVRQGDRGAAPHDAVDDDRDPDARFPQQVGEPRSRRSSPRGPTSTITISKRCRGSIRRSGPARAITRRCGCSRASSGTIRPIFTKSGVMVGLGEQRLEVHQVMDDMRSADVDFLTMGQYLQPTPRHAKVEEFVTPAGLRRLCRDRPRQGLPARRGEPADPLELPCRRRFREDEGRARANALRQRSWAGERRAWLSPGRDGCPAIPKPGTCPTRPSRCSIWSPT